MLGATKEGGDREVVQVKNGVGFSTHGLAFFETKPLVVRSAETGERCGRKGVAEARGVGILNQKHWAQLLHPIYILYSTNTAGVEYLSRASTIFDN